MERYRKGNIWIRILISFIIASICYVVIYQCFPMVYAINDDIAMRDIASGAFSGKPDGHLIFMKYALGFLLSGMYRCLPGFDWYGVLMTGLIMFCLGVLFYRGLSDIKFWKNKIIYLAAIIVLFLCVGLQHFVIFQWTMTAGILGATGVFLFYTSSEEDRLKNVLEEMTAAFMLVFTFCIRSDILFMVAPAAAICYVFKYVRIHKESKWRLRIRHVWFWLTILGGCAAVMLIETSAYHSEEWKKYQAFNNSRSEVYDFYGIPDFEENQEFYESIEMGKSEVQALENYSLFLVDGIYEDKMDKIAEYAKSIEMQKEGFIKKLFQGVREIYADFKLNIYAPLSWFSAAAVLLAVLICWRRRNRQLYLILAYMFCQALLWCYLGFQGRIVERVSFAMHLYMFLLAAGVLYKEFMDVAEQRDGTGERTIGTALVTACCCVLLVFIAVLEWNEVKQEAFRKEERNLENIELTSYLEERRENVYLMHTFSISHYTDNFKFRRHSEFSNIVPFGDWQSFSPLEIEKRERLGISNTRDDLYTKKNVFVVSRFDMSYMEECLQKAYGVCNSQDVDVVAFRDYLYWIKKYGNS